MSNDIDEYIRFSPTFVCSDFRVFFHIEDGCRARVLTLSKGPVGVDFYVAQVADAKRRPTEGGGI